MASPNGGIIGKPNKSSKGLNGVSEFTASSPTFITNPNTRTIRTVIVAGG